MAGGRGNVNTFFHITWKFSNVVGALSCSTTTQENEKDTYLKEFHLQPSIY